MVFELGVAYKEDTDFAVMNEVAEELQADAEFAKDH